MAHFQFTSLLVIGQEGENVCPSQVAVNVQLNINKVRIKRVITILLFFSCGGSAWTTVAY